MSRNIRYTIAAISIAICLFSLFRAISRYSNFKRQYESPVAVADTDHISPLEKEAGWLYGAKAFSEGRARVSVGDKWGYIDRTGKKVTPIMYKYAGAFHNGLAAVSKNGTWGYIDTTGKQVIAYQYQEAGDFCEGLAAVKWDGKYGYINKAGKEVIASTLWEAADFDNGLAKVQLESAEWALIDKAGKIITAFKKTEKYDRINDFREEMAEVEKSDYSSGNKGSHHKSGFINTAGQLVIPVQYPFAEKFGDGLAAIKKGDLYGFIDKQGRQVIPPQFHNLRGPFSEGLCAAEKNGKWGYINKKGETVIEYQYQLTLEFHNGIAPFEQGEKWGYIDKTGKEIIPARYDRCEHFHDGLAFVTLNNKLMFIDTTGKTIID